MNRTDTTVRLLVVHPCDVPETCVCPDSDKISVYERRPQGGWLLNFHRRNDAVEFYAFRRRLLLHPRMRKSFARRPNTHGATGN